MLKILIKYLFCVPIFARQVALVGETNNFVAPNSKTETQENLLLLVDLRESHMLHRKPLLDRFSKLFRKVQILLLHI